MINWKEKNIFAIFDLWRSTFILTNLFRSLSDNYQITDNSNYFLTSHGSRYRISAVFFLLKFFLRFQISHKSWNYWWKTGFSFLIPAYLVLVFSCWPAEKVTLFRPRYNNNPDKTPRIISSGRKIYGVRAVPQVHYLSVTGVAGVITAEKCRARPRPNRGQIMSAGLSGHGSVIHCRGTLKSAHSNAWESGNYSISYFALPTAEKPSSVPCIRGHLDY